MRMSRGMESILMRPLSGSRRMTMMVSARDRVSPGRASEPTMRMFVGFDSIPGADARLALAAVVMRSFDSDTAPRTAR